jgi:hypothetical protein
MIVRAALAASLATLLVAPAAPSLAKPLKQVYRKPGPIEPGSYRDPYFGRQGGRICARWCLQDRNPCDPPEFKVADGRCRIDFLDD